MSHEMYGKHIGGGGGGGKNKNMRKLLRVSKGEV